MMQPLSSDPQAAATALTARLGAGDRRQPSAGELRRRDGLPVNIQLTFKSSPSRQIS